MKKESSSKAGVAVEAAPHAPSRRFEGQDRTPGIGKTLQDVPRSSSAGIPTRICCMFLHVRKCVKMLGFMFLRFKKKSQKWADAKGKTHGNPESYSLEPYCIETQILTPP